MCESTAASATAWSVAARTSPIMRRAVRRSSRPQSRRPSRLGISRRAFSNGRPYDVDSCGTDLWLYWTLAAPAGRNTQGAGMVATDTSADRLVEAARALGPLIRESRAAIERERQLPAPLVSAMHDAALFRLYVPRALDGLEVDPATCMRVVEIVAAADGAAGWSLMIGTTLGLFAAVLPEEAARAVYAEPAAVVAGAFMPTGRVEAVEGGYRLNGRWSFASGIAHATWYMAGCLVQEGDVLRLGPNGAPEQRLAFFPAREGEVLDTWHVGGLRGTGSHDFAVTDLFVPDAFTCLVGGTPPRQAGPLYRFPSMALLDGPLACVPIGIARAAIDALKDLAGAKTPTGARAPLRERASVQADVARAEATLRAARAFLYETTREVWDLVLNGETVSVEQQALMRLARAHAAAAATEAVDRMYDAAGTTSLYEGSPLERCFRDVHAATKHVAVATPNFETCGRVLLELDPGRARL